MGKLCRSQKKNKIKSSQIKGKNCEGLLSNAVSVERKNWEIPRNSEKLGKLDKL